jgi:hypothetical protein
MKIFYSPLLNRIKIWTGTLQRKDVSADKSAGYGWSVASMTFPVTVPSPQTIRWSSFVPANGLNSSITVVARLGCSLTVEEYQGKVLIHLYVFDWGAITDPRNYTTLNVRGSWVEISLEEI